MCAIKLIALLSLHVATGKLLIENDHEILDIVEGDIAVPQVSLYLDDLT